MTDNTVQIVVTGRDWMGGGIGSIQSSMERLFREAKREIYITAYSVSNSADLLFDWLEAALARGILIRMVINGYANQPVGVKDRFRNLLSTYPHFHLYTYSSPDESDLHAKVIVADRRLALVGSSNLSRRGLTGNYEMAAFIDGPMAETTASALDRLFRSNNLGPIRPQP